ncbi:MAG: lysophospholipid acyltransferase family protein [Planctomycetota bacterium]
MLKYSMYKAIIGLASVLPRECQYQIAYRVADLNYLLDYQARRIVKDNVRIILGSDAPEANVRRESRWVFRSFGMYLCEFFGHRQFGPRFIDQHVVVRGREHLDAALAQGRGALFCSGHYSNWELGATVVAHLNYPIVAIVQMHGEPKINELFVKQREASGIQVVHSRHGATAAIKALRQNRTVAILGDRTTGGPVVQVQLCGRRTYLPQGPWRIALVSGAALLPTFVCRRFNYNYTLEIGAPIPVPQTGSRHERLTAMAQAWANCFETRLRADPSQWATFFRFWNESSATTALDQDTQPVSVSAGRESSDLAIASAEPGNRE